MVKNIQQTQIYSKKYGASNEGTWFLNRLPRKNHVLYARISAECWHLDAELVYPFSQPIFFLNVKSSHYPSHFASLSL